MKGNVYVKALARGETTPDGCQEALSGPLFIIRNGTDYWIPMALIKYNFIEGSVSDDPEYKAGVEWAKAKFDSLVVDADSTLTAVVESVALRGNTAGLLGGRGTPDKPATT